MVKQEEHESQLLKKMKDLRTSSKSGVVGFTTTATQQTQRRMLVIARIESSKKLSADIQAAVKAGADAIEIVAGGSDTGEALGKAITAATVPCGLFMADDTSGKYLDQPVSGLDWIHISTSAPASLLATKDVAIIVGLTPSITINRLPGLAGLTVDAVAIDSTDAVSSMTVDTLLAVCTLGAAAKGPTLATTNVGFTLADVPALNKIGLDGIIVVNAIDQIAEYVSAIENLPDEER